jgi:anti-sigma-K factor RskA
MASTDDSRPGQPRAGQRHPDGDTLALLALGEGVDAEVTRHVDGCGECRGKVESLAAVVARGRQLQPGDLEPLQPPPEVWRRISAETRVEGLPAAAHAGAVASEPAADTTHPRAAFAASPRPRLTTIWLAAAAVVGALVGGSAIVGWQALHDHQPRVVASAQLRALPTKHGSGTAEVDTASKGRVLSVHIQPVALRSGFLEVWLMSDPEHLISLGVLDHDSGTFQVPAGIDLDKYKIVDVSVEPDDGNPAHSTDSLVRGTLKPS